MVGSRNALKLRKREREKPKQEENNKNKSKRLMAHRGDVDFDDGGVWCEEPLHQQPCRLADQHRRYAWLRVVRGPCPHHQRLGHVIEYDCSRGASALCMAHLDVERAGSVAVTAAGDESNPEGVVIIAASWREDGLAAVLWINQLQAMNEAAAGDVSGGGSDL